MMHLLDTDILTLLLRGHGRVSERPAAFDEPDQLGISAITRIEILRGRFDSVFKAADGAELLAAQRRLDRDEEFLGGLLVIGINEDVAAAFDRLRESKPLRKIRRGDLGRLNAPQRDSAVAVRSNPQPDTGLPSTAET
jgi:tRNA(fMet)-specific endonuclease VapC